MKAVVTTEQGAQPEVTEVPKPQPGAGEVLVKVQASSVNGFDMSVAAGHVAGMMEHRYPVVLGKDFAGTVEAVGDGVSRFQPGDKVFGVVTKAFLGDGGFGEYVTVPEAVAESYADAAAKAGEVVGLTLLEDVGHFPLIDPAADACAVVAEEIAQLAW